MLHSTDVCCAPTRNSNIIHKVFKKKVLNAFKLFQKILTKKHFLLEIKQLHSLCLKYNGRFQGFSYQILSGFKGSGL